MSSLSKFAHDEIMWGMWRPALGKGGRGVLVTREQAWNGLWLV